MSPAVLTLNFPLKQMRDNLPCLISDSYSRRPVLGPHRDGHNLPDERRKLRESTGMQIWMPWCEVVDLRERERVSVNELVGRTATEILKK